MSKRRIGDLEGQLLHQKQPTQSTFLTPEDFSTFVTYLQQSRDETEAVVQTMPTASNEYEQTECYFTIINFFNARDVGLRSCKNTLATRIEELEKEIETETQRENRIDAELLKEQLKQKKCFLRVVDRELKREEDLKRNAMEVILASVVTTPKESTADEMND